MSFRRMHKPKGARLKRLELPSTLGLLVRSLVLPILFPMVRPGRSRGGPRPRRPIPPRTPILLTTLVHHNPLTLLRHTLTQVMGRYLSGAT